MFVFISILVFIVALLLRFIPNPWVSITTKTMSGMMLGAAVLFMIGTSFIFAREGHMYYVLSPFGTRSVVDRPGVKMIVPFSKIQEWEKYIDIKCIPTDKDGNISEKSEGIEGVIPNGIPVRFIDKVNASVFASVRFEIPSDHDHFIKLVETYRTPPNLVNNTLIPTITEQLTNVSFMYSAEDYVSGSATDYKMTIEDALKNGGFVVRKVEIRDTLYAESMLVDSVLKKEREIREIRQFTRNEKVFENGIPKRNPHEINVNKVITAQVIISDIKLEAKFEDKLTQQRDISAEKIIENQKIETARAAQRRIVAEGERDKTAERVKQETEQVQKLISIETQVKEEESRRQLADINLKTEGLKAQATRISADAEAYKNRQMVSAGLTPQEKAQIEKETAIGVAAEIAKMSTPEVVIMGGDGKSNDITGALIQAEMAKNLLNKK